MRSKKAFINIFSSLGLQLVTIICSFIVPRLIIGSFGSSVNGLTASITQFLAYITLLESGFGPVVKSVLYKPLAQKNTKQIEEILKSSEKFFRRISYIFIAYIVVLCIILPNVLSNEFNYMFTLSLIIIIAISTFAEYFFGITYRLFIQAEQKTYVISFIKIGTLILNTIMIIVLIKFGANIQIVKLVSSLVFVLRPILQNIYVKKKYKISPKNAEKDYVIKQKWDGLAQHIAYVVHNNTDIVILTLFTNSIEVSVYSIYLLVVQGVRNLVQSFTGGVDASFGDMIAKGEKESLNRSFKTYECFYYTIAAIVCITTLFLAVPFVSVYTRGITDADYIRPIFSFFIVLAEFMWVIRLPYNGLIQAAGHFRETRKGAWVEAGSNVLISLILVKKFGINGVAVGTLIAMTIRTIEFMYHASKHILNRNIWYSYARLLIIIIETVIVAFITRFIPIMQTNNYKEWIILACIVTSITTAVVMCFNFTVYKKEMKGVFNLVMKIFGRRKAI